MTPLSFDLLERRGRLDRRLLDPLVDHRPWFTAPSLARTRPTIIVVSPDRDAASITASAAGGGTIMTIPRPQLNTLRISSSAMPPVSCRNEKIAWRSQA